MAPIALGVGAPVGIGVRVSGPRFDDASRFSRADEPLRDLALGHRDGRSHLNQSTMTIPLLALDRRRYSAAVRSAAAVGVTWNGHLRLDTCEHLRVRSELEMSDMYG